MHTVQFAFLRHEQVFTASVLSHPHQNCHYFEINFHTSA